jgi:Amt family ammonium transporter
VFPVHGVGGILGTLLTAVFASNALGVFSGQHDIEIGAQLSTQAIGVVSAIVYTAVITFVILKVTEALVGNRVDDEDEMQGLDLISHDERGYDL